MPNVYEIEVDKRYHVELRDCCVSGHFDARVAEIRYYDYEEKDILKEVVFDNGVVLNNLYGVSFEEIEAQ